MKRTLRIIVCLLLAFAAVYLCGYGNLMNDISESLAITSFLGAVIVLSALIFLVWELYLSNKAKIEQLYARIEELERLNNKK